MRLKSRSTANGTWNAIAVALGGVDRSASQLIAASGAVYLPFSSRSFRTRIFEMHPLTHIYHVTDDGDVTELSEALTRVPIPLTDLRRLWGLQAELFIPLHRDAAKLLRAVPIPHTLCDMERIKSYIHSTSITPTGRLYTPQCSEIVPGRLWVADRFSATDPSNLQNLRITHVLALGHDELPGTYAGLEGICYARLKIPRDIHESPLVGIIDDAVTFIDEKIRVSRDYRLLVHCAMGIDWSPSVATAYLMNETGCSFLEARNEVRLKREAFRPDPAIEEAIQQWWSFEKLRPQLPRGRGYRKFRWAAEEATEIVDVSTPPATLR